MKTPEAIRAAAHAWCEAWNARDLDAVMAHYADDVELNSPTVVARWGHADGWLRGHQAVRANFAVGMRKADLCFEFVDVLIGANGSHAVLYRRENGALVVDLVEVDAEGRGRRVVACYGAGPR